ncbi:hypothetical protein AB9P05_23775 [Roseivirga sp. BDSF3-8]|uniref:hypothetical protein n=1 Tax=Roseivirga sp. BDSF3-8 TaxID=3241598 RepID=UPI003531F29F
MNAVSIELYEQFIPALTVCRTFNDTVCNRVACGGNLPRIEESCPTECPAPRCCSCKTITLRDRLALPVDFINYMNPCRAVLPERCGICPLALSCPDGPYRNIERIRPTLNPPDYGIYRELGMGSLLENEEMRESLHRLTELVTNRRYPVPPPWPDQNSEAR